MDLAKLSKSESAKHKGDPPQSAHSKNENQGEDATQPDTYGPMIEGVFMQGASWDKRSLKLIAGSANELYVAVPPMRLCAYRYVNFLCLRAPVCV